MKHLVLMVALAAVAVAGGVYVAEAQTQTVLTEVVYEPDRNIDLPEGGGLTGNQSPAGIWTDGVHMYVADNLDRRIRAYNIDGGAYNAAKSICGTGECIYDYSDIDTNTYQKNYQGLWSDGTTIWIVNNQYRSVDPVTPERILAYDLATKQRVESKEFDKLRAAGNTDPRGIWSDGTTMWVVDSVDDKVYAYNMESKERDTSKEFNLVNKPGDRHTNPTGLWSDGTTIWVANKESPYKVFAYKMSDKTRDQSKDISIKGGNQNVQGIALLGDTMYVAKAHDDRFIQAYKLPNSYYPPPPPSPFPEADLCPGGIDSTLNPTDLRAFGGHRMLTLAWVEPKTDVNTGISYLVRLKESGTSAYLNDERARGDLFYTPHRATHDIAGLQHGTDYDVEVRLRTVSAIGPDSTSGHTQPNKCSDWVSITGTTSPSGTLYAATNPLWSATLTVKNYTGGAYLGCDNISSGNECSSTSVLTDDDFTHAGVDYTVDDITFDGSGLTISFDNPVPTATALYVDGVRFSLADADLEVDTAPMWNPTGLSWSEGDTVSLRLVPAYTITVKASDTLREGGPSVNVFFTLNHPALAGGGATLGLSGSQPALYHWAPDISKGATVAVMQMYVPDDDIDNNCREGSASVTFGSQVAGGTYLSKDFSYTVVDDDGTADTCTGSIIVDGQQLQGLGGTEGDTGTIHISEYSQFDVQNDTSSGTEGSLGIILIPEQRAPTVSNAIADATIVHESGTLTVSLSGVFNDADNDPLDITAASSNNAVAGVTVSSDYSQLTVNAQARGTATITVTADDGNGGTVSDAFTVTVKAAPIVSSTISDVSGLVAGGDAQSVSLSGIFSDADADALTVTASSSDNTKVTVSVASDGSALTVSGVAEGAATITVTARDVDGNRVQNAFDVTVTAPLQPQLPGDELQEDDQQNREPVVSNAITDATIVHESGTLTISLSGVFSDADTDALNIISTSSNNAVAGVSVSSDYSELTVNAQARGTATITVTADDGNGGTVSDAFTVTVKAAPIVSSTISDVSGLVAGGDAQSVSLSGIFSDADSDALTVTASSSDNTKVTVSVASDGSALTVSGVAEGAATITVTARDVDGNLASHTFQVTVNAAIQEDPQTGLPDIVKEYDTNGDGSINYQEWQAAIAKYTAGELSTEDLHTISKARSY